TLPSTNGNPNFAVRRYTVPNENNNDGFSELTGAVANNLTVVPPVLSDGTFYITVYTTNFTTTNAYQFALQSKPATITDIPYRGLIANDDPTRVGWRFYRVTDIASQSGSLGWDLSLSSFAPGTRIALRRNAAPSFWNFRSPAPSLATYYDLLSTADFLQQPAHQADIWYIEWYNTTTALGGFARRTRRLP